MPTKAVAVTGADGYLGSAVIQALHRRGCAHAVVPGRLQYLPPRSLDCNAVAHCAGRLRGHSAHRMQIDNVTATAALLQAIPPAVPVVLASSRAAAMTTPDQYAYCKHQTECLVALHPGPTSIVRLTVLAGPSPRGIGSSFLSRMIKSAIHDAVISVPQQACEVDLLDVREAAEALVGLIRRPQERRVMVDATCGPVHILELAELITHAVHTATGQHVKLTRDYISGNGRPGPSSPGAWQELLIQNGVPRIPVESTIRDTVAVQIAMESNRARH